MRISISRDGGEGPFAVTVDGVLIDSFDGRDEALNARNDVAAEIAAGTYVAQEKVEADDELKPKKVKRGGKKE